MIIIAIYSKNIAINKVNIPCHKKSRDFIRSFVEFNKNIQIAFHISTYLPSTKNSEEQIERKKRHIWQGIENIG